MAARSCNGYLDQEKGADLSLDLQGLTQGVAGAIVDQDLIVRGHNCVPIRPVCKGAGRRTIGQGDCVWQWHWGFRRETHDKHDEDS